MTEIPARVPSSADDALRRMFFWRLINPPTRPLAGRVPWWVLLATTGRRSGKLRRVPLARGPIDADVAWLIAVHGVHASFAKNIAAHPRVRLKLDGRWRAGSASLEPLDQTMLRRFSPLRPNGPANDGHRTEAAAHSARISRAAQLLNAA